MDGLQVPLSAGRVHATASDLFRDAGDRESAELHRALNRETIMRLANSLPPEEPLRKIFLSATAVRRVIAQTSDG
jgi:hypothetical protein